MCVCVCILVEGVFCVYTSGSTSKYVKYTYFRLDVHVCVYIYTDLYKGMQDRCAFESKSLIVCT